MSTARGAGPAPSGDSPRYVRGLDINAYPRLASQTRQPVVDTSESGEAVADARATDSGATNERMRNDLTALETAVALLRRCLWPVVLRPVGAKIPTKNGPKVATGKEPIGKAWGKHRPTENDLRRRFAKNPGAGVGVLLGPRAGVIDVEVDGPEGQESLRTLFGGDPPPTMGWSSRRGPHWLFQWDGRLAALGKAKLVPPQLPGLEIRLGGETAQVQSAVPPTIGEDGERRRWNGCAIIARLPEAALLYLERATAPKPAPVSPREAGSPSATGGASPEARARAYVFAPGFPDSISGQHGHNRLYHVACVLVDGFGLTREQAMPIFRDWNDSKAIPPENDRQVNHKLDSAIKRYPEPSGHLLAGRPSCHQPALPPPVKETDKETDSGILTRAGAVRARARHTREVSPTPTAGAPPGSRSLDGSRSEDDRGQWEQAIAHARSILLPVPLAENPRLAHIARICNALSKREADPEGVFFVGARYMARAVGDISHQEAWNRMRFLGGLGYLEMVKPGQPGLKPGNKANRYRWHDPPIDGGAPWNSGGRDQTDEGMEAGASQDREAPPTGDADKD